MTQPLPPGFRSDFVKCGDITLHVVHNGSAHSGKPLADDRPAVLCLHGFPEFWIAWEQVAMHLGGDFLILLPDQRGYNLSDAPPGVENYRANLLVHDIISLADKMLGDRNFHLAGHDWGASIAYALAIRHPQRVENLVIANGVHPACFQQALIDSKEQAAASTYFKILRSADAGRHMSENDFARTFSMFEKFSHTPWLDEATRRRYRSAWQGPERLQAMCHWYNSSPIVVPSDGSLPDVVPLYNVSADQFRVVMPHLLVWGLRDQALRPETRVRLPEFCDHLETVEFEDGDHWLLHTHSAEIARTVRGFLD